jgi:peptide/nickel transport system substrate-binding protein
MGWGKRIGAQRLLLILIMVALLVGLPVGAPAQTPVLRLAWWTDVGFPTPFAFSTIGPGGVVRLTLIYDTLVWRDERGLIPWLAESWTRSPDGTAYVFRLRRGVRWHDGRELTAHDVKFSFDYYRKHRFRWVDTSVVQAAEVRDRHTVVLRLSQPHAPFLANIAGIVPIIPRHIWADVTHPERAQELRYAVGSGPFRLVEYRPELGQYRFVANDDYFRGRPVVREIQYVVVPGARQVLAVRAGEIDMAMAATYDVVDLFAGHPYLRVLQTEPLSIVRLIFNMDRAPTDHRAFRQAVAYGLDRQRIAQTITRGPGIVGSAGVVPPTDPWHNPGVRQYPFDPGRARALLRELGYADRDGAGWLETAGGGRLQVELLASPGRDAELVHGMLRDIGIYTQLRTVDAATRVQLAAEGRFQMMLTGHIGAGGDPDYLRTWFIGRDAGNEFAVGAVMRSPAYVRLAQLQLRTLDPGQRRRHIHEMQAMLSQHLPTLALYHRRFFFIYDSRKFTPISTHGGLMNGIPLAENKLGFLRR